MTCLDALCFISGDMFALSHNPPHLLMLLAADAFGYGPGTAD